MFILSSGFITSKQKLLRFFPCNSAFKPSLHNKIKIQKIKNLFNSNFTDEVFLLYNFQVHSPPFHLSCHGTKIHHKELSSKLSLKSKMKKNKNLILVLGYFHGLSSGKTQLTRATCIICILSHGFHVFFFLNYFCFLFALTKSKKNFFIFLSNLKLNKISNYKSSKIQEIIKIISWGL